MSFYATRSAFAEAEELLALDKVPTAVTNGAIGISLIPFARLLHLGHKRIAVLGVLRTGDKVWIDGDGLVVFALPLIFFIISVAEVKGSAEHGNAFVKVTLFGGSVHHRSPFLALGKRKNLPLFPTGIL